MTKVYYSISKTVVFKNFVPKQDLNLDRQPSKQWIHSVHVLLQSAELQYPPIVALYERSNERVSCVPHVADAA
jgi:hypothetical protein